MGAGFKKKHTNNPEKDLNQVFWEHREGSEDFQQGKQEMPTSEQAVF